MVRLLHRGRPRAAVTAAVLCAAVALPLAHAQGATVVANPTTSAPSYYVLKKASAKCRKTFVRRTVTLKLRRHGKLVKVHQTRCVSLAKTSITTSTGSTPTFPSQLGIGAVTLTIIPTAVAHTYSTPAGATLTVAGAGVLSGASGSGLSATLVSGPAHGKLTLNHDGSLSYTPASGSSGIEHFVYRATSTNGQSSAPASVTLKVTPVAAGGAFSVAAGHTLAIPAGALLGADVGTDLTASLVNGASGGTVTLSPDGSALYTPAAGFAGDDSFAYDAVDGDAQHSNTATVTIDVGAQPPTVVSQTFSGAVANTELQVGGSPTNRPQVLLAGANALSGDGDPNGGTLSTAPGPITTALGGSVTMASDGTFAYEPPAGFSGPSDSFSYLVQTSEGSSALATTTIDFNGARVWYVQSSASAGTGTSAAPFNALSAAASVSAPGDTIFLFGGGGPYDGGITLAANQALVGQGAALRAGGETLMGASGSTPVVTNTAANGVGITLAPGDNVLGLTVSGTHGDGIDASGVGAFSIDPSVSIAGAGGDGLAITGGSGTATIGASISGSAGHSVSVVNRGSGTVTLHGDIADSGGGVLLANDGTAQIAFTGTITASTGANAAFTATGGGVVSASSTHSTLTTTTGVALEVTGGSVIGAGGLNFQSISAGTPSSGPADAVMINGTGPANGPLVVLGDSTTESSGTPGSGGTIQHTSGAGATDAAISVSNAGDVEFADLAIDASAGDGIYTANVNSLSVSDATVTASAGAGVVALGSGAAPETVAVLHNTLTGGHGSAIAVALGGDATVYIDQNTIGTGTAGSGSSAGDGIDLSDSAGSMVAEVDNNSISQIAAGVGIWSQGFGSASLELTLLANGVTMGGAGSQDGVLIEAGSGGAGTLCVNPNGNSIVAAGAGAYGLHVEQLAPTGVFNIEGYPGSPTDTAAVATYLAAPQNTLTGGPGGGGALATLAGVSPAGFTGGGCTAPSSLGHTG